MRIRVFSSYAVEIGAHKLLLDYVITRTKLPRSKGRASFASHSLLPSTPQAAQSRVLSSCAGIGDTDLRTKSFVKLCYQTKWNAAQLHDAVCVSKLLTTCNTCMQSVSLSYSSPWLRRLGDTAPLRMGCAATKQQKAHAARLKLHSQESTQNSSCPCNAH